MKSNTESIQILIVDDHKLTNECLKLGLEKKSGIEILGQAFDGVGAVEMAKALKPTMILMDVCMPKQNGIQATAAIKQILPDVKVIMTTSMMDKKVVQAAFAANADGYCTKDAQLDHLVQMIRTVYAGAVCIDPKVALYAIREIAGVSDVDSIKTPDVMPKVLQDMPTSLRDVSAGPAIANSVPVFSEPAAKSNASLEKPKLGIASAPVFSASPFETQFNPVKKEKAETPINHARMESEIVAPIHGKIEDHLTQRELEILKLIADNNSNDDIAKKTGLSSAWLTSHIKNILLKLSVTNEIQAIRRALHEGLIEDAPLLYQD